MSKEKFSEHVKPPFWLQIFLWAYGLAWLGMIYITGLSSLRLGHVDYESAANALALSLGLYFICRHLPYALKKFLRRENMELWDIYDCDKKITGRTMKRNDWILRDGEYHLTVLGVVRHTNGKFLITRRVLTKSWAPGWWEVSGGAVQAGEESRTAVKREVLEETGLDVSAATCEHILTYKRENPGEGDNYFVDCYRFTLDFDESEVRVQAEEVSEFKLATLEEIKALGEQGIFLHYESIRKAFEA